MQSPRAQRDKGDKARSAEEKSSDESPLPSAGGSAIVASSPSWIMDNTADSARSGSHLSTKIRAPRQLDDNNPYKSTKPSSNASSPSTSGAAQANHKANINPGPIEAQIKKQREQQRSSRKKDKFKRYNSATYTPTRIDEYNASGSDGESLSQMSNEAFDGPAEDRSPSGRLKTVGEKSRNFSQILRDMQESSPYVSPTTSSSDILDESHAKSDSESECPPRKTRLTLKNKKRGKKEKKGKGKDKDKDKDKEKSRHVKNSLLTSSARILVTTGKKKDAEQKDKEQKDKEQKDKEHKENKDNGSKAKTDKDNQGTASPVIVSRTSRSLSLSNASLNAPVSAQATARTLELSRHHGGTPTLRESGRTSTVDYNSPRSRFSSPPLAGPYSHSPPTSPTISPRMRADTMRPGIGASGPDRGSRPPNLTAQDPLITYKTTLTDRANKLAVQVSSLQARLLTILDEWDKEEAARLRVETVRAANTALQSLGEFVEIINHPPAPFLDEAKKDYQQKQGLVLDAMLKCKSALLSQLKAGAMTYDQTTNTSSLGANFDSRDEQAIAKSNRKFASNLRYLISVVESLPEPKKKKKTKVLNSINLADLQFDKKLGEGAFGDVFKGVWRQTTVVAIKQLHGDLMEEHHRMTFLSESKLMMALPRHPNIVGCLGVCVDGDDCYLVLEFIPSGCLQTHLSGVEPASFLQSDLLELAKGIAAGMDHLEANRIVHRDLALRNILLEIRSDGQHIAKVSDFGMARLQMDVLEEEEEKGGSRFSVIGGNKIPIRWTAPEALLSKKYSSKSDVWSFGVTLWEIYSFGEMPYKEVPNQVIIEKIIGGEMLTKPLTCPEKVYRLMMQCWNMDPAKRPSFKEIFLRLREIESEEKELRRKEIQKQRAAQSREYQLVAQVEKCTNKADFDDMGVYGEVMMPEPTSTRDQWGRGDVEADDFRAKTSNNNNKTVIDDGMEEYGAVEAIAMDNVRRRVAQREAEERARELAKRREDEAARRKRIESEEEDGMGEYGEVTFPSHQSSSRNSSGNTSANTSDSDTGSSISESSATTSSVRTSKKGKGMTRSKSKGSFLRIKERREREKDKAARKEATKISDSQQVTTSGSPSRKSSHADLPASSNLRDSKKKDASERDGGEESGDAEREERERRHRSRDEEKRREKDKTKDKDRDRDKHKKKSGSERKKSLTHDKSSSGSKSTLTPEKEKGGSLRGSKHRRTRSASATVNGAVPKMRDNMDSIPEEAD